MGVGEVTRRSLLARALAATGPLVLARTSPAFGRVPAGVVFSIAVPGGAPGRARAAAAGWIEIDPVRSPRRFDLLGLEWEGPADVRIQLRSRRRNGRWSRWVEAKASGPHGPDTPAEHARLITDPVWMGGVDVFQVRSSRSLTGMRMHLVNSTGTATPLARARAAVAGLIASSAATIPRRLAGQPRIIPRAAWTDRGCRPRRAASFGRVRLAFVHHTVSGNSYRPRDSAAMVRGICHFHIHVQGWDDIGYNFLVDRYGQIFEGRAGGIDEPVIGAHAGGYNGSSTGIGNLGAFGSSSQSGAGFRALAHLIAWKLALHSIPAVGQVTVKVSRSGARFSRYRAGAQVSLNRIAGHRDACMTECPGSALYRQLPLLRRRVGRLAGRVGVLDLRIAPAIGASPATSLVGRLTTLDGDAIAEAPIEVQVRGRRGQRTVVTAQTAADGAFAASVALASASMVRALDRGGPGRPAVVSQAIRVAVRPHIDLAARTPTTLPGIPVQLFGAIAPVKRGLSLGVSVQAPDGTFAPVQTVPVAVGSDGRFSHSLLLTSPGRYRAVARSAADKTSAAGASAPVTLLVA
jgi:N-acetylmuramoyl-L-alanine amidase-like protein